jgi:endonuclease-3
MNQKLQLKKIISIFKEKFPAPKTELDFGSPFQLLASVILSAQCTDVRVNLITPALFKKFPTAEKMSKATFDEIFSLIRSCSYPNNKSMHLIEMSKMLVKDFKSVVPSDIEELQKLPGVGRKTANVVAAVVYNKPTMAVDTHVFRVSGRIGFSKGSRTPLDTEKKLTALATPDQIPDLHHWLILHGRYVCKARKPLCKECIIEKYCEFEEKNL